MIRITDEGRQLAADLANAERRSKGRDNIWDAGDFSDFAEGEGSIEEGFARLATQSIADKAHTEAIEAQLAEAKADLAEIDRLLQPVLGNVAERIRAIAAKHRVETDPLVEAFPAIGNLLIYHETGGHKGDGSDEALSKARAELSELAKRGIELAVKS